MATPSDVQALLRFLTQESKLPLPLALSTAKALQGAKLTKYADDAVTGMNVEELSKSELKVLEGILPDSKTAKKIWNAAKRSVKKRPADDSANASPSKKPREGIPSDSPPTPSQVEASLTLPMSTDLDQIRKTVVITNRAPLVLAFAVIVMKYTMPEQPLSSRLSLAQTVVSANSRTKAASIGLTPSTTAEDEGWGQGQPTVKILGREISVLKRYGYNWKESQDDAEAENTADAAADVRQEEHSDLEDLDASPALWGLDLEALRDSNKPALQRSTSGQISALPIHQPKSAREYLLKSFSFHIPQEQDEKEDKEKRRSQPRSADDKARCLGLLLGAIDELCHTWASTLDRDELDQRAWSWYVKVRPDIQNGVTGWGQKGLVSLASILDLKRQ